LLPFLEQESLREAGAGEPPVLKRTAVAVMAGVSLPVFHCPSRHPAGGYPFVHPDDFYNIDRPAMLARTDYAANVGSIEPRRYGAGPATLLQGDSGTYGWRQLDRNGVVFRRSEVRLTEVLDGSSQTYLVAEGYLQIEDYQTGAATNDDQGMYVGYDRDTLRTTHFNWPPLRDRRGLASDHSFGSAHAAGFHASLCDGSVRPVRYNISAEVHSRLGSRADGEAVNLGSL
jgi:hypothetical protein